VEGAFGGGRRLEPVWFEDEIRVYERLRAAARRHRCQLHEYVKTADQSLEMIHPAFFLKASR